MYTSVTGRCRTPNLHPSPDPESLYDPVQPWRLLRLSVMIMQHSEQISDMVCPLLLCGLGTHTCSQVPLTPMRSVFAQPDHWGVFPLRSRLSGFHDDLNMIGTSDRLAESCKIVLLTCKHFTALCGGRLKARHHECIREQHCTKRAGNFSGKSCYGN